MMIKSQLITNISKKFPQLPEKEIALCVNKVLDLMNNALSKGSRIEIRDFGGFDLRYRKSRKAHNPKTGEKVITLPKYTLHFKPGKELRERVDAGKDKPIQAEEE